MSGDRLHSDMQRGELAVMLGLPRAAGHSTAVDSALISLGLKANATRAEVTAAIAKRDDARRLAVARAAVQRDQDELAGARERAERAERVVIAENARVARERDARSTADREHEAELRRAAAAGGPLAKKLLEDRAQRARRPR